MREAAESQPAPCTRSSRLAQGWLWLSILALLASAWHVVIDFQIDVLPNSPLGLALVGILELAVYVVWIVALQRAGQGWRAGVQAAQRFALLQAALFNGVPLVFCPPVVFLGMPAPCPMAPWQDFAHLGSLVFGLLAFFALRQRGWTREEPRSRLPLLAISLPFAPLLGLGLSALLTSLSGP